MKVHIFLLAMKINLRFHFKEFHINFYLVKLSETVICVGYEILFKSFYITGTSIKNKQTLINLTEKLLSVRLLRELLYIK